MVLDGIILMYVSLNENEKNKASSDVSKITRQTLSTLRFETTAVIVNSLKLLEALASDHANEFIPDLGTIFPRIQRYMDDAKIAIRHHALKLGGALVVRIPFDIVGRFIFAAIEYKPEHPEISLKLAALALLSISPSYSMSSNPLLSRIMLIAGDYVDSRSSTNVFDSPRGSSASDVAKDTIALSLMTLCFSSQHVQRDASLPTNTFKNIEDMLPIKLSTILGIPPQSPLSVELCRRAKTSDFPSLRQDSYLSGLATIAMEASLVSQQSAANLNNGSNGSNGYVPSSSDSPGVGVVGVPVGGIQQRKKPNMSIKIPDFSVTPIKTNLGAPDSLDNNNNNLSDDSSCRLLHFSLDSNSNNMNMNGVSVLEQGSDEDISSCAPSMESYQPSWTPKDMGKAMEGSLPWAQPSNILSSPITTPLDRSKLKSIKKGGRKPGSRLRARTADEALLQDDVLMNTELVKMPATAGNDDVGSRCLSGVNNSSRQVATDRSGGGGAGGGNGGSGVPLTPVEVGFYSNDGTRSTRFEEQKLQQQIQKIKVSGGRRGPRVSATSVPSADIPVAEKDYFSAKGFKKMETLEFSSDSDNEQGGGGGCGGGGTSKNKKIVRGVAVSKPDGDPFGTKGGSLAHSDDEKEDENGSVTASQKYQGRNISGGGGGGGGEEEVKTFPSNRRRNNPPRDRGGGGGGEVEEEGFSVKGNSFQRHNSSGSQSNTDNKTQSHVHSGGQLNSGGSSGGIGGGGRNRSGSGNGGDLNVGGNGSNGGSSGGNGSSSKAGNGSGGIANSSSRHTYSSTKTSTSGSDQKNNAVSGNGNEHITVVVNQGEQPSGQEVFDYLERAQLEPCVKPLKEINKAVKELTTAEWPDIFYLLNTTRRLMIHHSAEIIKSGQLHPISLGMIKQVCYFFFNGWRGLLISISYQMK